MSVQILNEFFILTIKVVDYRVYVVDVDKNNAINTLNSIDLSDKCVL